ncbi:MAG: hypothetical protein R3293_00840 [Candidatus Promineifilaceae bacterium]|nr:hypothetical protein [Candidatus Promineifilaceae bacterium]
MSFSNETSTGERRPKWRLQWAIGIYQGTSPLTIMPIGGQDRPVLTAKDITDVHAGAVADPFFLRQGALWYLFFEVLNIETGLGEIACATSHDGLTWCYGGVVLREPFHLSYPQVFAWGGDIYMIPETRQDESVRLYRAEDFPNRWRCLGRILHGRFADATLLRHQDHWWLFAQRGLDELRLFMSMELHGTWCEHPASPLWAGNRRRTRPGGRILDYNGRLLRFAQDGLPSYGSRLRAFEIDHLNQTAYAEHEVPESPILKATRKGWNAAAMHHIDALPLDDGQWLAAVDGASLRLI